MGKHTYSPSVNRAGLVRRYAALRGMSVAAAEKIVRDWSRTELRETVEIIERDERPYEGARRGLRTRVGEPSGFASFTTMVDGVVR